MDGGVKAAVTAGTPPVIPPYSTPAMMMSQFPLTLTKGHTMKTLILAASLAALLVSGCAGLSDRSDSTSPAAGASAQSDTDTSAKKQSPYPAETDAGIF